MNALELKALLQEAAGAPVEKLALAEITKLGKAVGQSLGKLKDALHQEALGNILKSILPEDRRLFETLRKSEEKRKVDKLTSYKNAKVRCDKITNEIRPLLNAIRKANETGAIAILESLSPEQAEQLSLMANVSDPQGKFLKLTAKNRAAWLGGLGIKVSGFESAKRRKTK
ncbi:MAG: hypothetical protein K8S54_11535 [Spirochaetia bacterium]|nr:hypothetical protein [Spirochaetia bacterium]